MRELPPYVYGRECGENEKVLPLEQVLAIQRQAYEDGLRDAAVCTDSVGHHWSGAPAHAFFELADSFRAMITASQEKK